MVEIQASPPLHWSVWVPRFAYGVVATLMWLLTRMGSGGIDGLLENAIFFVLLAALVAMAVFEYRWQRRTGHGRTWHVWLYLGTGVGRAVGLRAAAPGLIPGGQISPLSCFHYLLAAAGFVGAGGALCFDPLMDERERRERLLADDFVEALVLQERESRRT